MILSFALTKDEFLSGRKTASRRDWKPEHLRRWQKAWDEGRHVHEAVDKVLFAGGSRIGQFKLTARPFLQPLHQMTPADLQAEGGMCRTVEDFCRFVAQPPTKQMVVLQFLKI